MNPKETERRDSEVFVAEDDVRYHALLEKTTGGSNDRTIHPSEGGPSES